MKEKRVRRVPPAFLRPLAHFICFCRYSCADCANRDGQDCDCEWLDNDCARIMACDWKWNGEWPGRRIKRNKKRKESDRMKEHLYKSVRKIPGIRKRGKPVFNWL